MLTQGMIVKIASEFCYVQVGTKTIQCKAKGLLRFKNVKPTVGDLVEITIHDAAQDGVVERIIPRRNELYRPRIANVDQVIVICSLKEPNFSHYLLNKFLAYIHAFEIEPVIVFTKVDLLSPEECKQLQNDYLAWYVQAGYQSLYLNTLNHDHSELTVLENWLTGKVSVFMGQTGAGKSSTLNALFKDMNLAPTQAISKALGRGKHTTTHVELYDIANGGKIADTPGFSSFQLLGVSQLTLAQTYFPVNCYAQRCKFTSCLHNKEIGCMIKMMVTDQKIAQFVYEDYLKILEEIKE